MGRYLHIQQIDSIVLSCLRLHLKITNSMTTDNLSKQNEYGVHERRGQFLDLIKVVFVSSSSSDEVKRSLVEHDGYDNGIVVIKRVALKSSNVTEPWNATPNL